MKRALITLLIIVASILVGIGLWDQFGHLVNPPAAAPKPGVKVDVRIGENSVPDTRLAPSELRFVTWDRALKRSADESLESYKRFISAEKGKRIEWQGYVTDADVWPDGRGMYHVEISGAATDVCFTATAFRTDIPKGSKLKFKGTIDHIGPNGYLIGRATIIGLTKPTLDGESK